MKFNTPEEVVTWADKVAAEDYERHLQHGIDLNPYCTDGARNDWQRGFDNAPPRSYENCRDYDAMFQRGRAAGRLAASQSK